MRKRLVLFTFDDPAAFPWGGEPMVMEGIARRRTDQLPATAASWGRAVAMGYARGERLEDGALLGGRFQVELNGSLVAVTAHLQPPR